MLKYVFKASLIISLAFSFIFTILHFTTEKSEPTEVRKVTCQVEQKVNPNTKEVLVSSIGACTA